MVIRKNYLDDLWAFKDKEVIKVVTGVRRSGKSTLFKQFKQRLMDAGVQQDQIISINFENLAYEHLKHYRKLYDYLMDQIQEGKQYYVFLDEIQEVPEFQRTVDSLFIQDNIDIYVTGSNAHLLSGDLATLLSGRYYELEILPLSFKEFYEIVGGDKNAAWQTYFEQGGFPYLTELHSTKEKREYLSGIYNTVLLKDIVARNNVRDVDVLESMIKFLFSSIGSIVSPKKIADSLTSYGRKTTPVTVEQYIDSLISSYIIYKVPRYDVKGKQQLRRLEKYYLVDIGLRRLLLQDTYSDVGYILENIIYLELIRRGYHVRIGRVGDLEIDFVAQKENETIYYQVSQTILDPNTYEREVASLKKVNDNFPKKIITMDTFTINEGGIEAINVIDFLLEDLEN